MATTAETSRWQGETDQRLDDHERRLNTINGSIERGANAIADLRVAVKGLSTKVAVWAALASAAAGIVGAIIAAVIVYKVTGHTATTSAP